VYLSIFWNSGKKPVVYVCLIGYISDIRFFLLNDSIWSIGLVYGFYVQVPFMVRLNLNVTHSRVCLRLLEGLGTSKSHYARRVKRSSWIASRCYADASAIPFRKQFKEEIKQRKLANNESSRENHVAEDSEWELTVGIEIHAQLNSDRKLFSG
jgi:hypothetical protein